MGSGIGAGRNSVCKSLRFLNGSYVAEGGRHGSGIGSSYGEHGTSEVRWLVIEADVNATSSYYGSGIGSGSASHGDSIVGDLVIVNGNVNARSVAGAGIGSGHGHVGTSTVGNLTVINGNITASSSDGGSGIGSSYGSYGHSTVYTLTIVNGDIDATGSSASGIGSGYGYFGTSNVYSLTILDGNITAKSLVNGPGIGSGHGSSGNSSVGELTIIKGNINAASAMYGAGIGSGYGLSGNSVVRTLTIVNGTINAISTEGGSGIGSGYGDFGNSSVESLTILAGSINATGLTNGAGIGCGNDPGGVVDRVILTGNASLVIHSGQSSGINATSIALQDASLVVYTTALRLFDSAPLVVGSVDLTIVYAANSSTTIEAISNHSYLEIGYLNIDPAGAWDIMISDVVTGWSKSLVLNTSAFRRLFVSVPSGHRYLVTAKSEDADGYLATGDVAEPLLVGSSGVFWNEAHLIGFKGKPSPSPTHDVEAQEGLDDL
jgi:hypothetical protein